MREGEIMLNVNDYLDKIDDEIKTGNKGAIGLKVAFCVNCQQSKAPHEMARITRNGKVLTRCIKCVKKKHVFKVPHM